MRYTSLSERTVRTCLGRLETAGLIRPCDPAVVAARIKRADRRPRAWDLDLDLDLDLIRDDLAEKDVAALECRFPRPGRQARRNTWPPPSLPRGALTAPRQGCG
jgi:hypothetical protein